MTTIADDDTMSTSTPATILCVDDEPQVLTSLSRLLQGAGYRVHVADRGAPAMRTMEAESVDLVMSDMRLPDMDSDRFLHQVRERWPQTIRFLSIGQADVTSVIEAVNRGAISRYITKPWDDGELVQAIGDALHRRSEEQDESHLAALALARAEELKAINASLQENVNTSGEELTATNERLKNNFVVSLKVFSILIESRHERLVGHSRRVADQARRLATKLGLEPALVQEVFIAALLHDLGKLAFSDELLKTPVASMGPRLLAEYRQFATRGEQLLMPLQDLRGAAASIGAQLERFDGAGFPNQLKGRAILVGARILSVCSDYDNLQIGVLAPRHLTPIGARGIIAGSRGTRYDPWVVDAFVALLSGDTRLEQGGADGAAAGAGAVTSPGFGAGQTSDPCEILTASSALSAGMILARDLVAPSGMIMLAGSHLLDSRTIDKILQFEKTTGDALAIYIKTPQKE